MKQSKLSELIANTLSLSDQQKDRLKNFKNPSRQPKMSPSGDYGNVLQDVLKDLMIVGQDARRLTIAQLNQKLQKIVKSQSNSERNEALRQVFQRCTGKEIKWVARLILNNLTLSFPHEKILQRFHPDAQQVFNTTSSLRQVAEQLADRGSSMKRLITMFKPVVPMLAGRRRLEQIEKMCSTGKVFMVQTKFDGERVQCHIDENSVRFFSRNSKECT